VYTLLSKQHALELREVRGGDEIRMNYLCEKRGVKLIGRNVLWPTADLIASIKAERGGHKTPATSLGLKSGMSKLQKVTLKRKLVRKAKIMRSSNKYVPPPNLNMVNIKVPE